MYLQTLLLPVKACSRIPLSSSSSQLLPTASIFAPSPPADPVSTLTPRRQLLTWLKSQVPTCHKVLENRLFPQETFFKHKNELSSLMMDTFKTLSN